MSELKMCPLLTMGILAGASTGAGGKIAAGWDRCQGISCQWWDPESKDCAAIPKWADLTQEAPDA